MRPCTALMAFLLLLADPAIADGIPAGKIKICRLPGVVSAADGRRVEIPAHSRFTTTGEQLEYVVATTAAAELGPKPACVTVPAEVTKTYGKKAIAVKAARLLTPQFDLPGAPLQATVVADFK
jgi:hypothetical protein